MERDTVSALVQVLVAAGYQKGQRAGWLGGIDGRVRGALPELGRPADQALSDVQTLLGFGAVGLDALGMLIRNVADVHVGDRAVLEAVYMQVTGVRLPRVEAGGSGPSGARGGQKTTILFLGANPLPPEPGRKHYRQLRIEREASLIEQELVQAQALDTWQVKHHFAATFAEFQRRLLDVRPQYLHIGCHGEPGKLVLVDEAGQQAAVPWKAVVALVRASPSVVGCVIMACDGAPLAAQVAGEGGPFAVGMAEGLSDSASCAYSKGFYLGLVRGLDAAGCHAQARLSVMALGGDEEDVPQFYAGTRAVLEAQGVAPAAGPAAARPLATPVTTLALSPWPAPHYEALGLPPPSVHVSGPPNGAAGPWQKHHPPGTPAWAEAQAGLEAGFERCESLTGRLAVLASTSYAMGAWLGLGLANLGVELEYWQAWGPPPQQWTRLGGAMDHGQAVLLASGLKAVAGDRPVALFVGITHAVVPAETGVDAHAQVVVLAPAQVKPDALSSVTQAQQAAWDLGQVLTALHGKLQGRHEIHVFYVGPLAVLMMAAGRLRTVNPVVVHERFAVGDQWKFAPAVRFEGGWARRV